MGYYKDLSYLTSKDGKKIKSKRLIKSSRISKWALYKTGAKKVIDLRTKGEAKRLPDKCGEKTKYINIPVFNDLLAGIIHDETTVFEQLRNLVAIENIYKEMVTNYEYTSNLSAVVKEIINSNEYPVLYHCTEGKDRTGLTTFILLYILGYDLNSIMEDYLILSKKRKLKACLGYLVILFTTHDKEFAEKIRKYLIADEKYLQSAITTIEEQYGSIDNFIQNTLLISDKEIEEFKYKILEK